MRHILEIPNLLKEYERLWKYGDKDDSYDIPDEPKPDVDYKRLIEELNYEKECWVSLPSYIRANGGSNLFNISYDVNQKIYTISFDDRYVQQLLRRLKSYETTKEILLVYNVSNYTREMRMTLKVTDIRKL